MFPSFVPAILMLHLLGQPADNSCIDLPVAKPLQGTTIELSVSIVQIGVHDSIEALQDGCGDPIPIVLYGGGEAALDLVELHVNRSDGRAHARIEAIVEIPQSPPGLKSMPHLNLRLLRVSKMWIEPAAP